MLPLHSSRRPQARLALPVSGIARRSSHGNGKSLFAPALPVSALPARNADRVTLAGAVPLTGVAVFQRFARLIG
jgi:hypothetical protein